MAPVPVRVDFPLWTVLPFGAMLLSIALLPLVASHFWHSNLRRALLSFGLSLPVIGYLTYHQLTNDMPSLHLLVEALLEYLDFIVLLAALYTVAGGIVLEGDLRPTPWTNVRFLAVGAVLANLVGTTGASMLLIGPFLRINRVRQRRGHLPLFFIFIVANMGGLLTPLGDPPLLLGFLHGVDFFWTLSLAPHWLLANGAVLVLFLVCETIAWLREPKIEAPTATKTVRLTGLTNVAFLAAILVAVLLHSKDVADGVTNWLRHYFPCPHLHLARPWGSVVMGILLLLSVLTRSRSVRQANEFTWEPMVEVAVLFAGIFVTMVPPLHILAARGRELGITEPWQYFWLTGMLSAFLDNAPTYLTFATIAAEGQNLATLVTDKTLILEAISCGAVFMGALTYIGNGPNFMVRAIAENAGYRMPSFFGYLAWSALILLPVFVGLTFVFF